MGTVEPVFDQIKQGRGFRQFLLRGLQKVQGGVNGSLSNSKLPWDLTFGRRSAFMITRLLRSSTT